MNVLGKKKEKGRRPEAGLNYAKLLRYSISHMTNLRNQTLDMLHRVCSRFQFQVGHPIADTLFPWNVFATTRYAVCTQVMPS